MRTFFKVVFRIVLVLYLALLVVALLALFSDPPWDRHGGYDGIVSFGASVIVGLPWTLMFLSLFERLHFSDEQFVGVSWAFAVLNVVLLYKLAFPRARSAGEASSLAEAGEPADASER